MSTNLTEALEDYLEAIYDIIDDKGGVRVKGISERLNVKNSSVTAALKSLRDSGFVNYEPYGVISLTEPGFIEARRLSETHQVFRRFFVNILGVDKDAANETACRMEHTMSPDVMARLLQFMKFISTDSNIETNWKDAFIRFCKTNNVSPGNLASPAGYMNSKIHNTSGVHR
ncbi:MAG: metal-dependent transcriptional regulator [Spirochaetaceae bacterium]|nr:metal-dependent transcriptional regulator [Spirochaetaceae bacterium]